MYQQSIDDPDTFWAGMAREFLDFDSEWDKVSDWTYGSSSDNNVSIKWFTGAKLNVTYIPKLPENAGFSQPIEATLRRYEVFK